MDEFVESFRVGFAAEMLTERMLKLMRICVVPFLSVPRFLRVTMRRRSSNFGFGTAHTHKAKGTTTTISQSSDESD